MIEKLRNQINNLDDLIIDLLVARFKIAEAIGKIKKRDGFAIEAMGREAEIIERLSQKLDPELVKTIYNIIFAYSRTIQKKNY